MTLSKAKLVTILVMSAVVGGALTAGGFVLADQKEETVVVESPSPTPSPTPSPVVTPSAQATAASQSQAQSETQSIADAAYTYYLALDGTKQADITNFKVDKVQGNFARTVIGGNYAGVTQILKKSSNGNWVVLWQGNGDVSEDTMQLFGIPQSIVSVQ